MSPKEIRRYDVINQVIARRITSSEAARILHLTARQIRRLKARVGLNGLAGLAHQGRGKASNRSISEQEKRQIVKLLNAYYADFGPTFAAEKLKEKHGIIHDPKTIRTIMITEQLWKPRRKKCTAYHAWRQRKATYGELVQYDGSYEHWFEDRGSKCCLLAAIDDATGIIIHAKFDEHEGVFPTFNFWKEYVETHGKPYAIYVDKFSTYSMNQRLAKENPDTLTQFQRAMAELHIEVITAHSSQAKGRVERLFKTLQDRLIKELRLNHISSPEVANIFLKDIFTPVFNQRFAVPARSKGSLHGKLTKKELKKCVSIFSRQHQRTVRNDFTLSYRDKWYQLEEDQPTIVRKKDIVMIEEYQDGSILFRLRGKYLNAKIFEKSQRPTPKAIPWVLARRVPTKPPANHPWRKFQFANH